MGHSRTSLSDMTRRGLRPTMRLRDEETGAILPLSVILLTVLLILSGVALDFMHFEARRTQILAVLDRASLAAASLSQKLDPELIVDDYLKKAGLENIKRTVTVTEGTYGEWRRVRIEATDTMTTSFMGKLAQIGIPSLTTHITSQAEEAIGNVEVSLVLDISGSMGDTVTGGQTRIQALRNGAKTFVEEIFDKVESDGSTTGKLSISVIPYNQQVVLGQTLANQFNLSTEQTGTTCGDVFLLPTNTIAISPSTPILRTMYGDSFDYTREGNNYRINQTNSVYNCPASSYAPVLPFSDDEARIKNKIDSLQAGGDTAIDVGARWGLALLDPAAQPVVDGLISAGVVNSNLDARPYDYDPDGEKSSFERSMKVMILMTDGQNTGSYSIRNEYRTGASYFYSTRSSTAFSTGSTDWSSLYVKPDANQELYLRYSENRWYAYSGGRWYRSRYSSYNSGWDQVYSPGTLRSISWPTVWGGNMSHEYVTDTFIKPLYDNLNYGLNTKQIYERYSYQSERSGTYSNTANQYDKDADLRAICESAKAKDILIYTLAVDAPSAGASVLRACSSGNGYYYDITSDELTNAFAEIASSMNSLRLTN